MYTVQILMPPCKMSVKGSNIPYLNRTGLPATENTELINFATQQHHEKVMFDTQQKSQTRAWIEGKKSISANSLYPTPIPWVLQHLRKATVHLHDDKTWHVPGVSFFSCLLTV